MSKVIDSSVFHDMTADQLYQAANADAETCSDLFHSTYAKQLSVMQRKRLIQQFHIYLNNSMHTMTTADDLDMVSMIRTEILIHKLSMANEIDKLKESAKKNSSAALYLMSMISFSDENKFNLMMEQKDNSDFTSEFASWLPQDFIYNICKEDPYKLNMVCRHPMLLDQLTDDQLKELISHHQLFLQRALHSVTLPEYPEPNERVMKVMQQLQSTDNQIKSNSTQHKLFQAERNQLADAPVSAPDHSHSSNKKK